MKFTYNSPFHYTLFKYVPQCEDIIHTSTPLAKSRLLVPQEVTNSLGDALKNDLAKDFTRHRQKGNSSPVVTITLRDPFFGILIIPPLLQSVGIFFLLPDLFKQGGQNGYSKLRVCFKQLGI